MPAPRCGKKIRQTEDFFFFFPRPLPSLAAGEGPPLAGLKSLGQALPGTRGHEEEDTRRRTRGGGHEEDTRTR